MRRAFVVEGEGGASMADADDVAAMIHPIPVSGCLYKLDMSGSGGRGENTWPQRVLGEGVLDVGQQQFLVLLFVSDAQFDQRCQLGAIQQRDHCRIDMPAPAADFVERGPRQDPARHPRVARPFGLVVRIEQERPALVERRVARQVIAQQERFPEPRGVREVPLGGRGVGHRLERGVRV